MDSVLSEHPSLYMEYPGCPPVVLSKKVFYQSPTFVKVCDKEYLAAWSYQDSRLHLFDIESKALEKVCNPYLDQRMEVLSRQEKTF